jgi:hypothetical protein
LVGRRAASAVLSRVVCRILAAQDSAVLSRAVYPPWAVSPVKAANPASVAKAFNPASVASPVKAVSPASLAKAANPVSVANRSSPASLAKAANPASVAKALNPASVASPFKAVSPASVASPVKTLVLSLVSAARALNPAKEVNRALVDNPVRVLNPVLVDNQARALNPVLVDNRAKGFNQGLVDNRARALNPVLVDNRAKEVNPVLVDNRAKAVPLLVLDKPMVCPASVVRALRTLVVLREGVYLALAVSQAKGARLSVSHRQEACPDLGTNSIRAVLHLVTFPRAVCPASVVSQARGHSQAKEGLPSALRRLGAYQDLAVCPRLMADNWLRLTRAVKTSAPQAVFSD